MTVPIPDSHRSLLDEPIIAVLTTLMPDGQPQSSLVWCDYDGTHVRVNITRERQKGKNVQADPRVSLLVIDPDDTNRWIEIRGEVTITEDGAEECLDRLTRLYTGKRHFYGEVAPLEQRQRETRITCLIAPQRVNFDAIHSISRKPPPLVGDEWTGRRPAGQ
jgi:PPOX class probable F420-dependent enzyme